jgi:hypothetical protein
VSEEAEHGAGRFGERGASAGATGTPGAGRRRTPATTERPSPTTVGRERGRGSARGGAGEGAGLGRLARAGQKGGAGPISKKNPFLFYFQIRILLNTPKFKF